MLSQIPCYVSGQFKRILYISPKNGKILFNSMNLASKIGKPKSQVSIPVVWYPKRSFSNLTTKSLFKSSHLNHFHSYKYCRIIKTPALFHGIHESEHQSKQHHHHLRSTQLSASGSHADVDPRFTEEVDESDHEAGTTITIYGLASNILLSAGKGVAGVLGNSTAMVADAVHSLGDLASDIVALYTYRISSKGPSPSYPYGYGRFDSLGGFVVALLLVATGIGIGYHAIIEIVSSSDKDAPPTQIALWAAAISLLVKEALFWMTLRVAKKTDSKVLTANAWHHRTDAISSALAFVGIGGEMMGIPHLDAAAGLAVAFIITKASIPIITSSVDEITDRNDFVQVERAIRGLGQQMDLKVDRLRVRKSGKKLIAESTLLVRQSQAPSFLYTTRNFKSAVRTQFPLIEDFSVELQEIGKEEYHPEHGDHPSGTVPMIDENHERVLKESKKVLPDV